MSSTSKIITIAISFLVFGFVVNVPNTFASTNIDSTNKWAWNDNLGWINFFSPGTVNITPSLIQGYAVWESFPLSYIALDCATSPNGNICSTSNFGVTNVSGTLAGWAWNDAIGWISFNCSNTATCATSNYSVTITSNDFSGWAWNDAIGWISFNCSNTATCATVSYKVSQVAPATGGVPVVDNVVINWSP